MKAAPEAFVLARSSEFLTWFLRDDPTMSAMVWVDNPDKAKRFVTEADARLFRDVMAGGSLFGSTFHGAYVVKHRPEEYVFSRDRPDVRKELLLADR